MELNFSKGTLTFKATQNNIPLPVGFKWDERSKNFRAPGYLYKKAISHFENQNITINNLLHKDKPNVSNNWKPISLYPYQSEAVESWTLAGHSGIITLPTGGGKTRVALQIIKNLSTTTLILVPTRALQAQWISSIQEYYSEDLGQIGDGVYRLSTITIATFESAYRHMWHLGNQFELLIADEAHHFGLGVRDEALIMSTATKRLGLTASLPQDKDHLRKLSNLLGRVVYEKSIGDLKGEYLSDFEHIQIPIYLSKETFNEYESIYKVYQDYALETKHSWQDLGWEAFTRHALKSERGRKALQSARRARDLVNLSQEKLAVLEKVLSRHWNDQTFIFAASTKDVCSLAKLGLAYPLIAEIKKTERESVLNTFREGKIRALAARKVLNEGIDVPSASVAIIVGGSSNSREQIQRIGRVLRKQEGKISLIYELVTKKTFEVQRSIRRNALI